MSYNYWNGKAVGVTALNVSGEHQDCYPDDTPTSVIKNINKFTNSANFIRYIPQSNAMQNFPLASPTELKHVDEFVDFI